MAYSTVEARGELLDALADSADELALALACLGEAYEQLDEQTAERLEAALFHPVQRAYGRAQRTHAAFAARYDLPDREFEPRSPGLRSQDARALIDKAVEAAGRAGQQIATVQDSMMPIEVGDAELRAGLIDVRELIDELPARGRELTRTIGR